MGEKSTKTHKTSEEKRAYMRAWYHNNPDKVKQYRLRSALRYIEKMATAKSESEVEKNE